MQHPQPKASALARPRMLTLWQCIKPSVALSCLLLRRMSAGFAPWHSLGDLPTAVGNALGCKSAKGHGVSAAGRCRWLAQQAVAWRFLASVATSSARYLGAAREAADREPSWKMRRATATRRARAGPERLPPAVPRPSLTPTVRMNASRRAMTIGAAILAASRRQRPRSPCCVAMRAVGLPSWRGRCTVGWHFMR